MKKFFLEAGPVLRALTRNRAGAVLIALQCAVTLCRMYRPAVIGHRTQCETAPAWSSRDAVRLARIRLADART